MQSPDFYMLAHRFFFFDHMRQTYSHIGFFQFKNSRLNYGWIGGPII